MRISRRSIRNFIIYTILVPIMHVIVELLDIPKKLGEHAIISWTDDKIAEAFGVTGPSLDWVVTVVVSWGPSAALALLCLSGWIVAMHALTRRQESIPATPDAIEPQQRIPSATSTTPVAMEEKKPLTMRQIFDSDFPGMGKTFIDLHFARAGQETKMSVIEFWNIPANSFFLAFYPHDKQNSFDTISDAAVVIPLIIKELGKVYFEVITPGILVLSLMTQ